MAQEDHAQQKYSNSNSSGGGGSGSNGGNYGGCGVGGGCGGSTSGIRSQKKMKQKKVPQRGLGVAQLEKIRLEEQQKKGVVLPPNQISISPSNSSPCLAVQCPPTLIRPSSISSVPLPPPSPSDLPSPNSLFRPNSSSIPSVDILHNTNCVAASKPLNNIVGGGEMGGWSAVPLVPGHGSTCWPKVWNGEFSNPADGVNQRLLDHHHGFAAYGSNVNLPPFESSNPPTPFLPLPNVLQRSPQFQPPSSSSMVNISSGISSSPVLNFPVEPPSNQNLCASNYPPLWPDEEKMIGMKRPYPFSMETPPAPAFHFKYPACYLAPPPNISRLDGPASCSNRCSATNEPAFPVSREGTSRTGTLAEAMHKEVNVRQNGSLDGDFLSLAPPAAPAPNLNSHYRDFLSSSGPKSLSEFGSQPSQGSSEDTIQGQGSSKSMQPPFFSFFPASKKQVGQAAAPANSCNGEVGENVDLSLKL